MGPERSQIQSALEDAFTAWCEQLSYELDKQIKEGNVTPIPEADELRANFDDWVSSIVEGFMDYQEWGELKQDLEEQAANR